MEKVIAIYREVNNPVTGCSQSLAAKTFTDRRSANNTGNGFNLVETTEDLAGINLPSGELVKLHNLYAKKPVNKFSDKATAVKRTFGVLSDLPTSNKLMTDEMELYREKVPATETKKVSKPRGAFAGKCIKLLVSDNPRKAGSHCHNSVNVIVKHGADMPYEEYIRQGGRLNDLKWDIDRKWAEVYNA